MQLPIKIAVIGCGAAFVNLYSKPLKRAQRKGWLKVIAIADPGEQRRSIAADLFPKASLASAAPDCFKGEQVDLTIIASPPPLHLDHVETAFAARSHVLCEKPIADSVLAGTKMALKARQAGLKLAIGQTRRFYPCLVEAKRCIREGSLGKITSYSYQEGGTYSWPLASPAPFGRSSSGGGALLDKGVHVFDALGWLFGPAEVLSAADDCLTSAGVECSAEVVLDHNGLRGRITLAWDQELANGFLIRGEQRHLWMPAGPLHDLFEREGDGQWRRLPIRSDFAADVHSPRRGTPRVYYECFDFQLIQVLRALLFDEEVPVGPEEAIVPLKVIEESYKLSETLPQPWLSNHEREWSASRHWRKSAP